jgi:hypothetical protein
MGRPWISFETGAAWFSGRPLIPVVAGNLDKSDVVEPLRSLQLLSLESPAEATQAFKELGLTLGDPERFCSATISLCATARSLAMAAEDWVGIDFNGSFYAWDGPLEDLREAAPKPMPPGFLDFLRGQGLAVTSGIYGQLSNEHSKGYSVLWLIDHKHRRRHYLLTNVQCILVRPEGYREQ